MKPDYHIVSFSGGKDSTAMLLHMLELGMQVDEIIFCDTGLEFPQMYEHMDKVERYIGRSITRVVPDRPFEYYFFDFKEVGLSWAHNKLRWCTGYLKNDPKRRYLSSISKERNLLFYVGIAADERYRLERKTNQKKSDRHPLVDWGWDEATCLQYCKSKGFNWGGLYLRRKRVSCWCCPLQSLNQLRLLYHEIPTLWQKLKDWDNRTWRQFRPDYSVEQLEQKFAKEDLYAEMQGKLF